MFCVLFNQAFLLGRFLKHYVLVIAGEFVPDGLEKCDNEVQVGVIRWSTGYVSQFDLSHYNNNNNNNNNNIAFFPKQVGVG